jgi:uncharacterized membrane protein YraQ (UPF0718 family)
VDQVKKQQAKAELSLIKALNSAAMGMTGGLNQTAFPVAGPMINIPSFLSISMIMKNQTDAVDRLVTLVDKLLDEIP